MYYCSYCQEAVQPTWNWETIQADEQIRVPICPNCGEVLDYEADRCPICGEWKSEHHVLCRSCYEELSADVKALLDKYQSATADRETLLDIIYQLFMEG